ncbi:MAG: right-handed parallel beta-helix repeat-containing protein [Bacteroidales bacterium]|nr:right-handed parallel beta-helix repeat-containing protein [Bacteroidales bacterium]
MLRKIQFLAVIAGIFLLTLSACEELVDETNEEDEITLEADAGLDFSAEVGALVQLDGGNSSSSEGSFTYFWEFSGIPSESDVQLEDANTATPSFTPDVQGDYNIELVITNGNQEDSDQVTVSVSAASATPIEVSGEIAEDMIWKDHISDPDIPDYHITGHVDLKAQLQIEPNVLVHVDEDKGFYVNDAGALISEGTAASPVIFDNTNAAAGLLWKGIKVTSSNSLNKLEHTHILHAGNSEIGFSGPDFTTAIGIEGGKLSLLNTTVEQSGGYGLFLHSGELDGFTQNSFIDNTRYAIRINAEQAGQLDGGTSFSDPSSAVQIYSSALEASTQTTWPDLAGEARYTVSGHVNLQSHLIIEPGASFDFEEDIALRVYSNGVLEADAAEQDRIVFTSKKASSGIYWKGIYVNSNDSRNQLSNVEISFAGNSEWNFSGYDYAGAIGIEDGQIGLAQATISNSKDYGIYVKTGSFVSFSSNNFEENVVPVALMANQAGMIDAATTFSNNEWDGIHVYGSTLTEEATWLNLSGDARYRITGDVYAENGLTLNPGVHMAFDEDRKLKIQNSGYFVADGTATDGITLTSSNEAGQIRWEGLWIASSDARNSLSYVTLDYAGGSEMNFAGPNYFTALGGDNDDAPYVSVNNSVISNSGGYAIYWEGGTINDVTSAAANNTFSNNAEFNDVVMP